MLINSEIVLQESSDGAGIVLNNALSAASKKRHLTPSYGIRSFKTLNRSFQSKVEACADVLTVPGLLCFGSCCHESWGVFLDQSGGRGAPSATLIAIAIDN